VRSQSSQFEMRDAEPPLRPNLAPRVPAIEPRPVTSVLVCGGEGLLRAGLRALVEQRPAFRVVAEVALEDAVTAALRLRPALVIAALDDTVEPLAKLMHGLRNSVPAPRVLALIASGGHALRRDALQAGAGIVVGKDDPLDVFQHAIKWLIPCDGADVDTSRGATKALPARSLSERELGIVRLVCRGLRNEQIASSLALSEATVRHYLTSIFAKRGVSSRAALIAQAYGGDIPE
jgi:DNA-binding NarL/FixJ family response regulator